MRVLIYALAFVLFVPAFSHAQGRLVQTGDSLLRVLHRQTADDTAKVNTLNALSRYYEMKGRPGTGSFIDTALFYARAALKLAESLHFKRGIAVAYRYIGNGHADRSDHPAALAFYQKALAICKQIGDRQGSIYNLRNIGNVYSNLSQYQKAITYYRQALDVARQMDDQGLIAMVCNDIGNTFSSASNYPDALDYYQKALKADNRSGGKQSAANTLMNIGWIYRNLSDTAKTLEYLEKALNLNRQLNNQAGIADCLDVLGNVYMNLEEYKKSREYYGQDIEIRKAIHDEFGLANAYANVALLCQFLSDYSAAVKYHQMSLTLFKKYNYTGGRLLYLKDMGNLIQKAPDSILSDIGMDPAKRYATAIDYETRALKLAAELGNSVQKLSVWAFLIPAYEKHGDYQAAYVNLQSAVALNDSIMGEETRKKIVQKEVQYTFEKKAAEAKALQDKKDVRHRIIRNTLISGLSLLIIFLVIAFRQRDKVKKEQKRSEDLLLNILPAKVVDELKETGKARAHRFDDITVLFTDFVNFTGAAETLSPEELVGELNECFTAFDKIMEHNGLEKIKTVGDAYMAACGLPGSRADHAQRAVQAAVDIMRFMQQRSLGQKVFNIRIGINSGPVVAGIVGVKKFAYDIWGDTVNTAARMEQNSEPGKINISEATYELVKGEFACRFRGEIEAKNKGKLSMYFVESKLLPQSGPCPPA